MFIIKEINSDTPNSDTPLHDKQIKCLNKIRFLKRVLNLQHLNHSTGALYIVIIQLTI